MKLKIKSKNKSISYVEIEDTMWGILPDKILHFFSLSQNSRSISEEIKEKLVEKIQEYAYSKAISYLTGRERSEKELARHLYLQRFQQSIISETISKLTAQNYLNNERFAELYTTDLIAKKKSSKEIYYKLLEKGISAELAHATLQTCYPEDSQIVQEVLEKAIRKYQNHPQKREKIIAYMFRKGFSYDEIMQAMSSE